MPSLLPTSTPLPRSGATADDLPAALLRLADADADLLADRLHDGVLQALVVARYAADAAVRGGDPGVARDAVQDALVTLRHAVWALRPRAASGLPAALRELSTQRVALGLPAPRLDLDTEVAAGLGPDAVAVAYRFVQAVLQEADPGSPVRVRLGPAGGLAALEIDGTLQDRSAWSLRARALGGALVLTEGRLRLLLPRHGYTDSGPGPPLGGRAVCQDDRQGAP